MSKSVLNMIQICPVCHVSFIEENGEVCACLEVPLHPFQPIQERRANNEARKQVDWHHDLGDCYE